MCVHMCVRMCVCTGARLCIGGAPAQAANPYQAPPRPVAAAAPGIAEPMDEDDDEEADEMEESEAREESGHSGA